MRRAAVALAAAMLASSTHAQPDACAGGGDALRAQGTRYTVHFRAMPKPAVGQHFALAFAVCAASGAGHPESVSVDARMPSHGHGMNYRPTVSALGGGRYQAEGLMFHMPGEWEVAFTVKDAGASERITYTLVLR